MRSQPRKLDLACICRGRDLQRLQFSEDGLHGTSGVAEKLRTADACENPTHAFEDGLPVHVFRQLLERLITVAIAFECQTLAIAFDNEIDPKRSDLPVRCDAVARYGKAFHHFTFKVRLRAFVLLFESTHKTCGVFGMLNQLPA